ncbi:hypothetical protein IFT43_13425 [Oxalobacteraceae sp. CFBP 13708]|nr:hypothetical protein [Oxalobacteraceae sp. CFBP 13708]
MSMLRTVVDPAEQALSRDDRVRLQGVVNRLARAYPPDWLERCGALLYGATIVASLGLTGLVGALWSPWWTYLIPVVCPLLLAGVLPVWLFGREPGRPRWAHPLAIVSADDAAMIGRIVDTMNEQSRAGLLQYCPANDGAKVFALWQLLQAAGVEEPR